MSKEKTLFEMDASEITAEAIRRSRNDEYSGRGAYREPGGTEPIRKRITIDMTEYEFGILFIALEQLSKRHKVFSKSCLNGYGKASSQVKSEEHLDKSKDIQDLSYRISMELI